MLEYTEKIRETAKKLLEDEKVDVFIGYKKGSVPMMNVEHRTLNIEHRMRVSLRSFFSIKLKRRRRTIIQRWKFDVRCWTFVF